MGTLFNSLLQGSWHISAVSHKAWMGTLCVTDPAAGLGACLGPAHLSNHVGSASGTDRLQSPPTQAHTYTCARRARAHTHTKSWVFIENTHWPPHLSRLHSMLGSPSSEGVKLHIGKWGGGVWRWGMVKVSQSTHTYTWKRDSWRTLPVIRFPFSISCRFFGIPFTMPKHCFCVVFCSAFADTLSFVPENSSSMPPLEHNRKMKNNWMSSEIFRDLPIHIFSSIFFRSFSVDGHLHSTVSCSYIQHWSWSCLIARQYHPAL